MSIADALALKDVLRQGWLERGHPNPESVAAHSWGVSWLVLALLPADLDRERALVYAIIHDLAEVWVGDLTPHDAVPINEKHQREDQAMVRLCGQLERPDLLTTWRAYEAQADPEARFVRQLDRLDMALQARRYAGKLDPAEFVASADAVITDPTLRAVLHPGGHPS